MELVQGRPHPSLGGTVLRYAGYSEHATKPVCFRELPCTYVPIVLDLGEGWRITPVASAGERHGSFVAGLTETAVLVEHGGRARCLQIDLTPFGARALLGLPMSELANQTVALEDVLGRPALELVDRLADAGDWPARFELVDSLLRARLADRPIPSREVGWAFRELAATRVGALAGELGWSHRRLIARFRDEVGLPPKLVARILRFERLLALLRAEPGVEWAWAAAAAGYADQAHLVREVKRFSGLTPTALRAERVNSVQDGEGIAV